MKIDNDSDTLNGAPAQETAAPGVGVRNSTARLARRKRRSSRAGSLATGADSSTLGAHGRCFVQATADDLNQIIDAVERARSVMNRRCDMHRYAGYWRRR
jgi:hypothetical protein